MVYLLLGEEDFLKREFLAKLKADILGAAYFGLNYDEFDSQDEDGANKIIDCARTAPFMAKSRLVVIRQADELGSREKEDIALFIKNKPKSTTLALVADSMPAADIIYSCAAKYGQVRFFNPLKGPGLRQWVVKRFLSFNKKIQPQAIEALIENIGSSMLQLDNAIEMFVAFTGSAGVVTLQDIQKLTEKNLEATTFQLVDAIGARDAESALKALEGLSKDSNAIIQTTGLIGWHLRKVWRVKKMAQSGLPMQRIAPIAGIRHDRMADFFKQVNRFSVQELERYFNALLKLDKDIKSTALNPYRALEILVIKLCAV